MLAPRLASPHYEKSRNHGSDSRRICQILRDRAHVRGWGAETSRVRGARGVAGSSQFDHRLSMVLVLVLVLWCWCCWCWCWCWCWRAENQLGRPPTLPRSRCGRPPQSWFPDRRSPGFSRVSAVSIWHCVGATCTNGYSAYPGEAGNMGRFKWAAPLRTAPRRR